MLHVGQGNSRCNIRPQKYNYLNLTKKELSKSENKHSGDLLCSNLEGNDLLIGFINVYSLTKTRRGNKNLDPTYLMLDMKFDRIELAETYFSLALSSR